MRVHLLAPPNTETTAAFHLDGFTQATIRFARLLTDLHHHVILYAGEDNEAPCAELVTCVRQVERDLLLEGSPYQYAAADNRYPLWQLANSRMIEGIAERKQPRDLICTIGGIAQQVVADAHPDLQTVEYSIGYIASFAPYRVYESRAWQHASLGCHADGRFFDTVIPLFFEPADYPYRASKEPFALYVGRLTHRKGIGIACQAAAAAGVPLFVIGHGDPTLVTHGAVYLGELSTRERNDWMARASALLCPTQYVEPFGSVVVEAALCGTPAITTDFGGFVETVHHGVTGFRCNYLGAFVRALHAVPMLDPKAIRDRAVALYSLAAVAPQYQSYFDRLSLLWDQGWNTVEGVPLD